MIDLLLLLGVGLCALSVVMAVVSVLRTQAPRAAALALVLGIIVLFAASWAGKRPLDVASLNEAWTRVASGAAFGTNSVTAPPPALTQTQTAPLSQTSQPAAQAPMQDNASGENPAAPVPAETPAENSGQPQQ